MAPIIIDLWVNITMSFSMVQCISVNFFCRRVDWFQG